MFEKKATSIVVVPWWWNSYYFISTLVWGHDKSLFNAIKWNALVVSGVCGLKKYFTEILLIRHACIVHRSRRAKHYVVLKCKKFR